jgi:RHS repeat-associated protein
VPGSTAVIVQQSDYYPYGMMHKPQAVTTSDNRHLFNGKELQNNLLGGINLDIYDYGARFYDPQIGRFTTQDRFSEKYFSFSNYSYAANNPVLMIDINGDSIRLSNIYQKNDVLMKTHTEWMKTDAGKNFYSLFGEGGKFENVAVVFDVASIDDVELKGGSGAAAVAGLEFITGDKKQAANGKWYEDTPVSKEVQNAANGGSNDYLKFTISIANRPYGTDRIVDLGELLSHESQHPIIEISSIAKRGIMPSIYSQHKEMAKQGGQYFNDRYNSYWQFGQYWKNDRSNGISFSKYVTNKINDFIW